MKNKPVFIIYFAMFAVLLWFDRFLKNLIIANMRLGDAIPSQDSFVAIRYTVNTGVSFGLLSGHTDILIVLQIILFVAVSIACFVTYIKLRNPVLQTGLVWIVSGGAGNIIDRISYGHVVDFISVGTFPVWNFADMCIVGGCILFGIFVIKHPGRRLDETEPELEAGVAPYPDTEADAELESGSGAEAKAGFELDAGSEAEAELAPDTEAETDLESDAPDSDPDDDKPDMESEDVADPGPAKPGSADPNLAEADIEPVGQESGAEPEMESIGE